MFKNMKLSTKLWGLTAVLLLAVLIVAGSSIWSIKGILSASNQYSNAAEHSVFMHEKEVDHLTWMGKVLDLFANNVETLEVELDHTKCGLGRFLHGEEGETLSKSDPELAALLDEIKKPHVQLHESGQQIKDVWRQRHKGLRHLLKDRLDDHRRWAARVSKIVIGHNPDVDIETDHTLCSFGIFLESEEYDSYSHDFPALHNAIEAVKEPHKKLHESANEIKALVKSKDYQKATEIYTGVTLINLEIVQNRFNEAIAAEASLEKAQSEAYRIYEAETTPAVRATQAKMAALAEKLDEIKTSSKMEMVSTGAISKKSSVMVTIITFVLGVLLSFFMLRSIIRPIHYIIDGLNEGAEQVTSASDQVASSSQQLAEGSSEQAAALEETSSSLEEMSSMTKQNAAHATEADALNKNTNQVIGRANGSMGELTASMKETTKSSEEISKIIKTIDEIAFQTNLLALNAAVEAARAGEAGAGFAVVADEVRNLAMRSANAAKNTSTLIEGTVKQIKNGSELVGQTNEAFSEVAESAEKVGELVGEIAAASTEQADGIEQVNKAVLEMDGVVQQNAANAEENAAASEEMSSMAAQMKYFVSQLVILVDGDSNGSSSDHQAGIVYNPVEKKQVNLTPLVKEHKKEQRRISPEKTMPRLEREVTPDQIIPMDENFEDF